MPQAKAGWFDDGSGELRWWDGTNWTSYYVDPRSGRVVDRASTPAIDSTGRVLAAPALKSGPNLRPAVVTAVIIGGVILLFGGPAAVLIAAGLVAAAVGVYAVINGSADRLKIRTRRVAVGVLLAGLFASGIGGAAIAANRPANEKVQPFAATGAEDSRSATPTSSPTPTPVRVETIIEERAPVAFSSSSVNDPNLDIGVTAIVTAGVDGEKVTRIRVTTVDGVEVAREVIEEVVAIPPTNEVIAIGSRQPPAPAPAGDGCDPNYDGACVPISSDVDCAGGSGNGPAYVDGPVWIVGSDIYDLDRDGDGIACDA